MKKIFEYIGLTSIICISLIMSKKTTQVVKNIDTLKIKLQEKSKDYETPPINAIINENKITPGVYGKKVNIEKTYKELKKIGIINDKYFKYDEIKPDITKENQYDKYIVSGNSSKKMISIILIVNKDDKIEEILKKLEKKQTKIDIFADGKWIENNKTKIKEIIEKGYSIHNLGYNLNYHDKKNTIINNMIKKISKQKITYCLSETENEKILQDCAQKKIHTIIPEMIKSQSPLIEIKKKIKSGSIIAIPLKENSIKEIEMIIEYINSKGYKIENIQTHLSEK